MTVDARLLLTPAPQAFASTAVSTDSLPLGVAGLDVGAGEPVGLAVHITTSAEVATGDETYSFQIVTATASNLTTNQVILVEREFSNAQAASLTAGTRFIIPVPVGLISATATHIGARVEVAGTVATGVAANLYFTPLAAGDERNVTVRSGFTVAA
jgi:hypothetical protein